MMNEYECRNSYNAYMVVAAPNQNFWKVYKISAIFRNLYGVFNPAYNLLLWYQIGTKRCILRVSFTHSKLTKYLIELENLQTLRFVT